MIHLSRVAMGIGACAFFWSHTALAQTRETEEMERVQPSPRIEIEEYEIEEYEPVEEYELEEAPGEVEAEPEWEQEPLGGEWRPERERRMHRRTEEFDPARQRDTRHFADMDTYEPMPSGVFFSIGGGVNGYTDPEMSDFAGGVGGMWEARLGAGTREFVGVEAAYVGAAQDINALGLDDNAILLNTMLEGNLRINLVPRAALQPFITAGAGWQRFDVTNADFNTSSVRNTDNTLMLPVGAGLAYRFEPLIIDVRGIFRPVVAGANLIQTAPGQDEAELHTWSVSLRAGWEF